MANWFNWPPPLDLKTILQTALLELPLLADLAMTPCASDGSSRIARVFQRYSQGIVSSTDNAPGYVERGNPSSASVRRCDPPLWARSAAQILHREQIVQKDRNLRLHGQGLLFRSGSAEKREQLVIHALVSVAEFRRCAFRRVTGS